MLTLGEGAEGGVAGDAEEGRHRPGESNRNVGDLLPSLHGRFAHRLIDEEGIVMAHESCIGFGMANMSEIDGESRADRHSPKTMMPVAGMRSELAKRHDSAVSVLKINQQWNERRKEKKVRFRRNITQKLTPN